MLEKIRINILGLYIALIPFDNFRFLPFSLSSIIGVLFILLCFDKSVKFNKTRLLEILPFFVSLVTIIGSTIIFHGNASIKKGVESLPNAIILSFIMIVLLALAISQESMLKYYKRIAFYLFLSAFFTSLTGYYELYMALAYQVFVFGDRYIQWVAPFETYMLRVKGLYFDPNYFSVIPLLGLMVCSQLFKSRLLEFIFSLFFLILIIATLSRMAAIATFMYLAIRFIPRRLFWYAMVPIGIVSIPVLISVAQDVIDFFYEINSGSSDHRLEIITGTFQMIRDNPLFGYGFNTLSPIGLETHNTFLQILLYGGLISFVCILFPIFFVLYKIEKYQPEDASKKLLRNFLISSFFPVMIALFFLSYLNIKFLWVYLILLFLGKNKLYTSQKELTLPA